MKNGTGKILLSGLLILPASYLFAGGNSSSFTPSLWLYLSLAFLLVIAGVSFILYKKHQVNTLQLNELHNTIKELQKKLNLLERDKEKIIQQRIKSLRVEFENRKQNIKSMKKALEEAKQSASRNSFLLTKISNTLRTNLNDILGFSLLLENEFALNEEKELFEYNENIRKSGASLMHLLNNIIDISKIEAKNFHLKEEKCILKNITTELISRYEPSASQKEIKIVFQNDNIPPFASDCETIKHIFSNLLDNAVRYTETGFIKITQTLKDKEVIWTIKDTGAGIDIAYLPDIFEPFRGQSLGYNKNNYQGSGLGLPLIKSMLNLMGGKINISSEKAKGTTVTIRLPFKLYSTENTASELSKQTKPKNKKPELKKSALNKKNARIIIFDKDKIGNMLIKKILPEAIIEICDKESEFNEWTNQQLNSQLTPDILMIELDFTGEKNGSAILQKLRKKYPAIKNTPVVALSAYPDSDGAVKAKQQGFTAYLQKPFHKNDLIFLLNQLMSS